MIRILFAHPDKKFSHIYTQHMKGYFLVDSVHDGLSAIRQFKLAPPAIILSDYHLPLVSGISFLKSVRRHPTLSGTPFIFLSNHPDNTEALNWGANDWLRIQECQPEYVLNRLNHHLKANKYGIQIQRA